MEEAELRALIEDVRTEKLPRRSFIERLVGLGLTAPIASMLLMHAGVAQSQPAPAYKPTKRGGGGALKMLFWQARRCSSRISPSAPRTRKARAFSTSRSRAGIPTAIWRRCSPPKSRHREWRGRADGMSVTWKLKKGVTGTTASRSPPTMSCSPGNIAGDPATASTTIGNYRDIKVEKVDPLTVRVIFPKPTPFWASPFVAPVRHDHPEASVRALQWGQFSRSAGKPEAGRHRPLSVCRL